MGSDKISLVDIEEVRQVQKGPVGKGSLLKRGQKADVDKVNLQPPAGGTRPETCRRDALLMAGDGSVAVGVSGIRIRIEERRVGC